MSTTIRRAALALAAGSAVLILGCGEGEVRATYAAQALPADPPADLHPAADPGEAFRSAFEAGAYEALPDLIRALTAAYLEDPSHPETTLLLAHAHLWRISESARLPTRNPRITEHLILADRYFEEAARLSPGDHRIPGWLGSVRVPLGRLQANPERVAEGYRALEEGVRLYPEFNHFTAAFTLARLPPDHERFPEALAHMQANVQRCSGSADASPEDANPYELARRADPACANTSRAPHNFEGFLLTYGDILVKAGRGDEAREAYRRARSAPEYHRWPYREVLENRIQEAHEAARHFRALTGEPDGGGKAGSQEAPPELIFGSGYSCSACHTRESGGPSMAWPRD